MLALIKMKQLSKFLLIQTFALCMLVILTLLSACSQNSIADYETAGSKTLETAINFKTSDQLSGFGGANMQTEKMQNVKEQLNSILKQGKMVSFVVINTKTQRGFSYNADRVCVGKSTIKAPYITSLLMSDSSILDQDTEAIKKAITYSNNESYKYMRHKYGNDVFKDFCEEVKVDTSKCEAEFPKNMTVRDLAKM